MVENKTHQSGLREDVSGKVIFICVSSWLSIWAKTSPS